MFVRAIGDEMGEIADENIISQIPEYVNWIGDWRGAGVGSYIVRGTLIRVIILHAIRDVGLVYMHTLQRISGYGTMMLGLYGQRIRDSRNATSA